MSHTRILTAALALVALAAVADPATAQTAVEPALEVSLDFPCDYDDITSCTGTGPTFPGGPL